MRTIKFRAWDKLTSQWVQFDKPPTHTTGKSTSKILVIRGSDDNVDFQQFTGMTDKNGVEIFEGDIILSSYADDDELEESKEVVFNGDVLQWYWGNDGGNSVPLYEFDMDNGVVIGNIYENSKLIGKDL